ncbi:unnamed protein product [Prorocentrum cordatum]|uniref:Uncharacterized protein n=1 Tax=Prorocentrum cordatum TaxID=2364126 RepID=A0ABN9WR92_9DINO|nr:unnamed protein product [Polarella glacialis]
MMVTVRYTDARNDYVMEFKLLHARKNGSRQNCRLTWERYEFTSLRVPQERAPASTSAGSSTTRPTPSPGCGPWSTCCEEAAPARRGRGRGVPSAAEGGPSVRRWGLRGPYGRSSQARRQSCPQISSAQTSYVPVG